MFDLKKLYEECATIDVLVFKKYYNYKKRKFEKQNHN